MASIELRYGHTAIPITFDDSRFELLAADDNGRPLTDAEIGDRLDAPTDSARLEDIVKPPERVLIVVPDATRQVGAGQIVNLLVRRLIANGSAAHEINIIFATGIHRAVTTSERDAILTPFVAARIKTHDHHPYDPIRNFRVGTTSGGIPVELNWLLTEFDHIVLIGGVAFHYFAGFTGGRKLVCPGLASAKTIEATHKLAFDPEKMARRSGVGTARLDGNAVHEAFIEAARLAAPSFAVNTIVNDRGEVVDLYCGDWIVSHQAACDTYVAARTVKIKEKRDVAIVSCGGYPYDLNMIQAHKALDAAADACVEGGTIILLAECADGLGRRDFLDWFDTADSSELAERLCRNYQVNGQTAWSLLRKAERFNIRIVTSLSAEQTRRMRMEKIDPTSLGLEDLKKSKGFILPSGAKLRIAGDQPRFI